MLTGRPVEEEKRARRGVLGELKWGALERVEAFWDGVKVPLRRRPLACAGEDVRGLSDRWEALRRRGTNLDGSSQECRRHRVASLQEHHWSRLPSDLLGEACWYVIVDGGVGSGCSG